MKHFLSCDWGTSSFRLRLVEVPSLRILSEEKTDRGIAATNNEWQEIKEKDHRERLGYFLEQVRDHIEILQDKAPVPLKGLPVIFSGMASSSIGMMELPYGTLPFHTSGSGIRTAYLQSTPGFDHPLLLISGIRSDDDVMRGEETELIGVIAGMKNLYKDQVFILPGTHSKHIQVKDWQVIGFRTYMTGEYFHLLSKNSILSSSVESGKIENQKENTESFRQGVLKSLDTNLLNSGFLVRTNDLFAKMNKQQNLQFLNGLIIGTELKDLLQQDCGEVVLCGSSGLGFWYETALETLGINKLKVFSGPWLEQAVVRGQYTVYQQLKNK